MFILHKVEVTSFEIWLKIYIDKQEVVRHLASNSGRNIPRERQREKLCSRTQPLTQPGRSESSVMGPPHGSLGQSG